MADKSEIPKTKIKQKIKAKEKFEAGFLS